MSQSEQLVCSICGEPFQNDDVVVKYRSWPEAEKLCHVACAMTLAKKNEASHRPHIGSD